jgi:CRP-like cAMP-binding protein
MLMKTLPLRPVGSLPPAQGVTCDSCAVRSRALFGTLDGQALHRMHDHVSPQDWPADHRIYSAGGAASAVYTIRRGIVRFERFTEGGYRRIVRLAGPGDLIGQEAVLGKPYSEDALSCTAVQLCRIDTPAVTRLLQDEEGFQWSLLSRWQQALDHAHHWVTDLTTGASRRRFLVLLGRLASFEPETDVIWLPRREDIGAMLDMSMETASRLVSVLKREGVIELMPPSHARLDRIRWRQALDRLDA